MDYGFSEKRTKRKDKRREKKKHPYRKWGSQRSREMDAGKIGNKS